MFLEGYPGAMPRRTQAERRATTRKKLEIAAIDALVARGVSGATSAEICKRAGVSQGALFQHYTTKQALLVAAVKRLYATLRARFAEQVAEIPDDVDPTRAVLQLVWESFYRPDVVATLELWAHCRTEPELKADLVPMLDEHWLTLGAFASGVLPAHVLQHPNFTEILGLVLAAVQSAATSAVITGGTQPSHDATLDYVARLLDRAK